MFNIKINNGRQKYFINDSIIILNEVIEDVLDFY